MPTRDAAHGRDQRVLLLAYRYPPENTSGARRPERFSKYLPHYGMRPEVVSRAISSSNGSVEGVHRVPGGCGDSQSVRFAARVAGMVERVCLPYPDSLSWVPYAVAAADTILKQGPIAAVISTFPPVASHLAGLRLKQRFGLKWIADFRDPLAENPFRTRRLGRLYDQILQTAFLEHADAVICNTKNMADLWRERYPHMARRIFLIWNGYDPDDDLAALPVSGGSQRVLTHVGSLYGGRDPGVLVEPLERLLGRGRISAATTRLELIGPVEGRAGLLDRHPYSTLRRAGCLTVRPERIPREEANTHMRRAHYLVLLDVNESGTKLQVPAKLFDYVRVGRPILCFTSPGSPTEYILSKSGVRHVVVHPGEAGEAVEDKLMEFLSLPAEAEPASLWFEETFNAKAQAGQLAQIVRGVVSRR